MLVESKSQDEEAEATPKEVGLLLEEEVASTEAQEELHEGEQASVEDREAHHEVAAVAAFLEGEVAQGSPEEPTLLQEDGAGSSQRNAAPGEISLRGVQEYPGTVPDVRKLMEI